MTELSLASAFGGDIQLKLAEELERLDPGPHAAEEVRELIVTLSDADVSLGELSRTRRVADACERVSTKYVQALGKVGIEEPAALLMKSWFAVMLEIAVFEATRVVSSGASSHGTARQPARVLEDTSQTMTAQELANALSVRSDETVRHREKAGELFSILPSGRKRGRAYPAFQSWKGIAGKPLSETLRALAPEDGTVAYAFFTSVSDLLAGLSPIECLMGELTSERTVSDEAKVLLGKPSPERRDAVVKAAKTQAAIHFA